MRLKRRWWFAVAAVLLAADRATKWWAASALKAVGSRTFWPGIIGFRYAENTGAAFSFLKHATGFLALISILFILLLLVYLVRHPRLPAMAAAGLTLVATGGLGNALDRVLWGYVVDFIELIPIRFAIFNFADICITAGAALVILAVLGGGVHDAERVDG